MAPRISVEQASFAELLKRYRKELGLSQEALAERANMSTRGVSDLERGLRRAPYRDTVAQLATALELDVSARASLEQAARRSSDSPEQGPPPRTSGRENELVKTKLTAPLLRTALVHRQRLLDRLDTGLAYPLTVVSAQAGSGKTTLLSAWHATLRGRGVSPTWVSLDASDNDPSRFWRYVLAALEPEIPDIDSEVLTALLTSEHVPGRSVDAEVMLTALMNALVGAPGEIVLVLEDYHVITAQAIHDGLTFLLDRLPPQIHLFMTTRADPPLPLTRLRARGLMTELRAADLRFTTEEAAIFLKEIMELPLTDEAIGVLDTRTEGWIAGLQMAVLSLQGRSPEAIECFVTSFNGSHRYIVDFLVDEVLARLPAKTQSFLLRTSILDRLCASLCAVLMDTAEAQLGTPASHELLEDLERGNLFVVGLDDYREWYRYHHLFAAAMRHRLQRHHQDEVPELHRRASAWFEQQGLLDEAIGHALQAGAYDRAADLMERYVPALHALGARLTLETWIGALPEQIIQARPRLSIVRAWLALHDGVVEVAEQILDAAEYALHKTMAAGADQNVRGEIAAARAVAAMTRHDPVQAIIRAREALDLLSQDNAAARGYLAMTLGQAYAVKGELENARAAYDEARKICLSSQNRFLGVRVMILQSYIERAQGRLHEAIVTYRQALDWSEGISLPDEGLAHALLADLLRESNDLEDALQHAMKGAERRGSLKRACLQMFPRLVLARVKQAQGDVQGALDVVRKAQEAAHDPETARYVPLLQAFEAQVRLAQGDLSAAVKVTQPAANTAQALSQAMHPFFVHAYEHIAIAPIQVLIAQGHASGDRASVERALVLLDHHRRQAERTGFVWLQIKTLALQALAHHALEDRGHALAALREALILAQPEGYIRLFADEGELMADLLREVDAPGISAFYQQQVIRSASPASAVDRPDPPFCLLRAS